MAEEAEAEEAEQRHSCLPDLQLLRQRRYSERLEDSRLEDSGQRLVSPSGKRAVTHWGSAADSRQRQHSEQRERQHSGRLRRMR